MLGALRATQMCWEHCCQLSWFGNCISNPNTWGMSLSFQLGSGTGNSNALGVVLVSQRMLLAIQICWGRYGQLTCIGSITGNSTGSGGAIEKTNMWGVLLAIWVSLISSCLICSCLVCTVSSSFSSTFFLHRIFSLCLVMLFVRVRSASAQAKQLTRAIG